MKKHMFWIAFGCLLLLMPVGIKAQETSPPQEVIVAEEETPQAGGKRYQQSMMLSMIGMATLVGVVGYVTYNNHQKHKPHLAITNVTDNGDGSYIVNIGFNEPLKETTTFHNADINVSKGSAIILKKINKCELTPSESKDVFVAIVNKDTQLKCQLDNQVIDIDGMQIMKGVKHE